MKKAVFAFGLFFVSVFTVLFVFDMVENQKNNVSASDDIQLSNDFHYKETNKEDNKFLDKDDSLHLEDNSSNAHLHLAHTSSAVVTGNATFDNGGEPLNEEQFIGLVKNIQHHLSCVKADDYKSEEIDKIKQLVDIAVDEEVKKGDQKLEKIHNSLHDIYEEMFDYNPDIKANEYGDALNDEDLEFYKEK